MQTAASHQASILYQAFAHCLNTYKRLGVDTRGVSLKMVKYIA